MVATGLIYTAQHVQIARENRTQEPFVAAWNKLDSIAAGSGITAEFPSETVYGALRWSLLDDVESARRAVESLRAIGTFDEHCPLIDAYQHLFGLAQSLACLDNFSEFQESKYDVLSAWHARLKAVDDRLTGAPHERAWSVLLRLCAGILLGRSELTDASTEAVRELTDSITAHGYVAAVVEGGAGSLERTIQFVQALCLAAEAGTHAGIDLWAYERRGVSVMTGAMYPLYYYYYPEKWPWDGPVPFDPSRPNRQRRRDRHAAVPEIELEPTQALFRRHASFLELINRRTAGKVRAVTLILDEIRPIVDLFGGGAVTLTHAVPPPPKRRGLFGR